MMTVPADKPSIPAMPSGAPKVPEAIRVKILYLGSQRIVPLNDCDGTMQMISAGPSRKDKTGIAVEIQYEPWHRHHRVRELDVDDAGVPRRVRNEFCISEVGVVYVPAATGG